MAAETGLLGLALFAWLVAVALYVSRGSAAASVPCRARAGVVLVAIAVHSLFYSAFFEDPMVWALLGLMGLVAARRSCARKRSRSSSRSSRRRPRVVAQDAVPQA